MRAIDRFDLYMKHKGLNDNKVTNQLKLSNGTIGKSRKDGRDLSDRVIEIIEKFYLDLNPEWLRTGVGEMLVPVPARNTQVIGSNHGTAINGGDQTNIQDAEFRAYVFRKDAQVDELLAQNGKLIDIIQSLTKTK